MTAPDSFVRAPASSANLGAGFDVLGMALGLYADVGLGDPPEDGRLIDEHHPGSEAFAALGGTGPIWLRSTIPMARGLGFSGAVRVAGAALAKVQGASEPASAIGEARAEILSTAARLEGHGDNAAATLCGGVVGYVDGLVVPVPVGPTIAAASFVAWIPDVRTSTDKSRRSLGEQIERADAVHNLGRVAQFVAALAADDVSLLVGSTADRLHQHHRLPLVPGGADALQLGVEAGAWCGWLSGSGPTVGFLCSPHQARAVAAALPGGGSTKVLALDMAGTRLERGEASVG